jgi:hypothetical protein
MTNKISRGKFNCHILHNLFCRGLQHAFVTIWQIINLDLYEHYAHKGSPRRASLAIATVGAGGALIGKHRQEEVGGSMHWLLAVVPRVLLEQGASRARLIARWRGWERCWMPRMRWTGGSRQLVRRHPGLDLGPLGPDLGQRMACFCMVALCCRACGPLAGLRC